VSVPEAHGRNAMKTRGENSKKQSAAGMLFRDSQSRGSCACQPCLQRLERGRKAECGLNTRDTAACCSSGAVAGGAPAALCHPGRPHAHSRATRQACMYDAQGPSTARAGHHQLLGPKWPDRAPTAACVFRADPSLPTLAWPPIAPLGRRQVRPLAPRHENCLAAQVVGLFGRHG